MATTIDFGGLSPVPNINPQARDITLSFENSCNCFSSWFCCRPKEPTEQDHVYVRKDLKVEFFDYKKSKGQEDYNSRQRIKKFVEERLAYIQSKDRKVVDEAIQEHILSKEKTDKPLRYAEILLINNIIIRTVSKDSLALDAVEERKVD